MKTEKNIFIAFILNIAFSIFEVFGGIITGSIAIISDAIHDFGDALSIGVSFLLERKSKKKPDNIYTYGYQRYSILGALITTLILTSGECIVIYNAILRLIHQVDINYNGMIIFAIIGVIINFLAAYVTKEGNSINQKSVNLHMLEDVLGWIIVLLGSILMKFTDIKIIDSIMSIGVAIFILIHAFKNFKEILDLFLVKIPKNINVEEIKNHLKEINEVLDIHHIHVWSLNGEDGYATMHIKTNTKNISELKHKIREELLEHGINHVTIEIENKDDLCEDKKCIIKESNTIHHHQHHH